jgi:hypothetical protein
MAKKDGGATFNFNGEVKVEGGMYGGDKIVHNYGDTITNIQNIQSPAEFVQALRVLQEQIAALKEDTALLPAQKEEIEIVEGKIVEVVEASQSEKPSGAAIRKTLDDAKAMLDSIGGAATSAIGLGAILAQIADMAIKVFGG